MSCAIRSLAAVLAVTLLPIGHASAQEPVVLKFAANTPAAGAVWSRNFAPWAKKIEADSEGTIKMELYPDGMLGRSGDTLNRVRAGIADIGWDQPPLYGATFASVTFAALPGVYKDDQAEEAGVAAYRAYVKGLIGQEFKDFKILFFQTGQNYSLYFRTPPKSHTELKGVKMALGSKTRAQMIQQMGGVPVALTTNEYYQGLSKGTVDGTFSNIASTASYKLDEVLRYYLYGPFGGSFSVVAMNKAKYDSLPPKAKAAIDKNTGEEPTRVAARFQITLQEEYMAGILKRPGNTQAFLTADEIKKWQPAYDLAINEWLAETPNGKAILEAFKSEFDPLVKDKK